MNRWMLSIIAVLFAITAIAPVANAASADPAIAGLWLFDELTYPHTTLTDASIHAKADLTLMDAGEMVPGRFGRALKVNGGDYAVCYAGFAGKVPQEEMRGPDGKPSGLWGPTEGSQALLDALAGNEWTIEFWINAVSTGTIIDMGQGYAPGLLLTSHADCLELTNSYAGIKASCPAELASGKWSHVALVRSGSQVKCFVDGKEAGPCKVSSVSVESLPDIEKPDDREHGSRGFEDLTIEQRKLKRFNFAIGTNRRAGNAIKGMFDEMRISSVARYSGDFTPISFSSNYRDGVSSTVVANGPALLFDPAPVSLPLKFGARKHVFIDDAILVKRENMQITMNKPWGKEPLKLDFKIKKSAWRPSLFDVGNEIFMAIPESYSSNEGLTLLATSTDGISFNSKGKIIPETPMYGAFFEDLNPAVDDMYKYKVNSFVANRGMYFYTSRDGLNWRRNETIQLPLVSGGGGECYWDDQRGTYVSFIKRDSSFRTKKYPGIGPKGHKAIMFETNEPLKPWPFKAIEKPWYEGWPFPSVTGEGPTVFTAQKYGWVYRTRAIKYPWAPDVYLAFIWRYPGDDGARHVELAVSRNGKDWQLFGTNWYIPTGAYDEEIVMYGLLRRADEIWQYVNEGAAHGGNAPRHWSRYKQRIDGFVSLDAAAETGTAMTLPMVIQGSKLLVNIKAAGWARFAITDEDGKAYPGFSLDDCDTITGDFTGKVVTWKGNASIRSLAGKTVRLKFQMQDAKLYSFDFSTKVLLLGDSISGGYRTAVEQMLKGKAKVVRPLFGCESTIEGLAKLDKWLGNEKWDVIHFNWGLHDLKYVDSTGEKVKVSQGWIKVPVDQYAKNLEELVIRLKKTGAKLIFATTTPVPEGSRGRVPGDEVKYNVAAIKVMNKYGITINDLHSLSIQRQAQIQRPRNVHFTVPQGYDVLARQVAEKINEAIDQIE